MKESICPECGEKIPAGVRICPNCDYELTEAEYKAANPEEEQAPAPVKPEEPQTPVKPAKPAVARPAKPAPAAPESIMAHGSVDASQHHSEDNSTHNIDNSQTVHNTTQNVQNNTTQNVQNTIIIMGGGAQLPAGVDPQTAEAVQRAQAQAQQVQQPRQPQAQKPQNAPQEVEEAGDGEKGIGSIDGRRRPSRESDRRGAKKWIGIAVAALIVIGGVTYFANRPSESSQPSSSSQSSVSSKSGSSSKPSQSSKPGSSSQSSSQTVSSQTVEAPTATKGATVSSSSSSSKTATSKQTQPKTLAQMTPAEAYREGMKLYNKGEYEKCLEYLEKAANSRHADAAYQLGEMYLGGVGVEANKQTAISWYKVAAAAGHKGAKRKLF